MRSRGRSPRTRGRRLFVELLEDRTNPAGFVDPSAATLSVTGFVGDRVNVVTAGGVDSPAAHARLAAAPFAASVQHSGFGIYTVTLGPGIEVGEAVTYYSQLPGVTAAEP